MTEKNLKHSRQKSTENNLIHNTENLNNINNLNKYTTPFQIIENNNLTQQNLIKEKIRNIKTPKDFNIKGNQIKSYTNYNNNKSKEKLAEKPQTENNIKVTSSTNTVNNNTNTNNNNNNIYNTTTDKIIHIKRNYSSNEFRPNNILHDKFRKIPIKVKEKKDNIRIDSSNNKSISVNLYTNNNINNVSNHSNKFLMKNKLNTSKNLMENSESYLGHDIISSKKLKDLANKKRPNTNSISSNNLNMNDSNNNKDMPLFFNRNSNNNFLNFGKKKQSSKKKLNFTNYNNNNLTANENKIKIIHRKHPSIDKHDFSDNFIVMKLDKIFSKSKKF